MLLGDLPRGTSNHLSASSSVDDAEDIDMIGATPTARSQQMSDNMATKLQCDEIRVDQAIALLENIVIANTYLVREKDMIRIKAEGKPLWSVTQIMEEYDGDDDEEYVGRYVMVERGEDRRKCHVGEIEVSTIGAS
jgi:hypothetical protein